MSSQAATQATGLGSEMLACIQTDSPQNARGPPIIKADLPGMFRAGVTVLIALAALCLAGGVRDERAALMSLYDATEGASWANNSGWGSGAPVCSWFGIECNRNGSVTRSPSSSVCVFYMMLDC